MDIPVDSTLSPTAWERDSICRSDYAVDIPAQASAWLRAAHFRPASAGCRISDEVRDLADEARRRMSQLGFVLLSNWPLDAEDVETAWSFAAFGDLLGTVRAQDGDLEWWRFVEDRPNADGQAHGTSGSTGCMQIALHTENARPPGPPRYIGLLCIRVAATGGGSILASGPAVRRRLCAAGPSHLRELQSPIPFGRRRQDWQDGREVDWQPVFGADHEPFHFRYSRYWIDLAVDQSNVELSLATSRALDAIDAILEVPGLPIRFKLQPGEAVLVDNRVVMHGRDAFEDETEAPRRLVRIWID